MAERRKRYMRVLYASAMMRQADYEAWFSGAQQPSQATQKYGRLLTRGLAENGAEVIALSAPPVLHTGGNRPRLRPATENGVAFCYLPVLNMPVLKNFITLLASFFTVLSHCDRETVVLCYGLNVSVAEGARLAAKLLRRPSVVIVSDVPEQLGGGRLMRMAQRAMQKYDGYVLLTEAMHALVNPFGKPYIVLEGQADASMAARENALTGKRRERTCLYAGMLHGKYGALRLTEAFTKLPDPDIRLVLYGTGDAEGQIAAMAERDKRIEFRGVADNAEVVEAELSATLLVNPRPSDETFTKYSFPSKNLEYMASGTPLLTTDLPGMPAEYREYVYLFSDETPEGMAQTLRTVLSLSREALAEKGALAKAFVLNEKSNVAQARRMLDFMEGLRV